MPAKLVWGELGETGHDARPCGHGQQLQLHAAHPAHGRQLARHQQVIRLIVEPPAQQIN